MPLWFTPRETTDETIEKWCDMHVKLPSYSNSLGWMNLIYSSKLLISSSISNDNWRKSWGTRNLWSDYMASVWSTAYQWWQQLESCLLWSKLFLDIHISSGEQQGNWKFFGHDLCKDLLGVCVVKASSNTTPEQCDIQTNMESHIYASSSYKL